MRMAGGMAHDFNNYLAAIQGNNELVIAQSAEDAPYSKSVNQIQSLTRDSLGLTFRIQVFAGQTHVKKENLSPCAWLSEQSATFKALVAPDQTLTVSPGQDEGLSINADPELLALSLSNLITNASEIMLDQGGTVGVTCGVVRASDAPIEDFHNIALSGDSYVYFEVSDDGPGMARSVRENAFDPFYSTKIRAEGMGLPVTLGIAWAHDGAIQLDTQDSGTRIRILLPA